MSARTAADLEIEIIIAIELLKRKVPAVDLPNWGRRIQLLDSAVQVVDIPAAAVQPLTDAIAVAVSSVSTPDELNELVSKIEAGDLAGVQQLLADVGVMLVPLQAPNQEGTDGPADAISSRQDPAA